jgi:hypothetical protein
VYILHQTVIIVIAWFVIRQPWAPWTKYWIVLAGTLVVSVALYHFLIRRIALLRFMFGLKGVPLRAQSETSPQTFPTSP